MAANAINQSARDFFSENQKSYNAALASLIEQESKNRIICLTFKHQFVGAEIQVKARFDCELNRNTKSLTEDESLSFVFIMPDISFGSCFYCRFTLIDDSENENGISFECVILFDVIHKSRTNANASVVAKQLVCVCAAWTPDGRMLNETESRVLCIIRMEFRSSLSILIFLFLFRWVPRKWKRQNMLLWETCDARACTRDEIQTKSLTLCAKFINSNNPSPIKFFFLN